MVFNNIKRKAKKYTKKNNKMIAIVSSSHYPDDERIYQKQICSLMNLGKQILYITKSNSTINLSRKRLTHVNFDSNLTVEKFIIKTTNDILKREKISYLQIHETELLPLLKIVKNFLHNVFTIYDVHENMDALYRTFSQRHFIIKELAIMKRNLIEMKHLKFVDQIILANPIIKDLKYEKFKASMIVLENFVEKRYIIKEKKLSIKPNLIYHGHLGPERGIEHLVKAMNIIVKKFKGTKLSLLGSFRTGVYETKIRKLISDLTLENNIHIISQVPYSLVWGILKKHTIGIIPFNKNPLTESCVPTKLFEMMASLNHIVVSDLAPIRYFVNDSVFWSKPGDHKSLARAIESAITSLGDNRKTDKNLSLVETKYNWDIIKNNYLNIFR